MNKMLVLDRARTAGFMAAAEGRACNPAETRTPNANSNRLIREAYEKGYRQGTEWRAEHQPAEPLEDPVPW